MAEAPPVGEMSFEAALAELEQVVSRLEGGQVALEESIAAQALKRALRPEDTADVVAFLASDGAAAMTGQVLVPDGGACMR